MTRSWLLSLLLCVVACTEPPAVAPVVDADAVELHVTSTPSGATITIDGAPGGTTPVTAHVRPGPHRVQAVLSGMYPVEPQRVVVSRGAPGQVHFSMVASH
jgi:hypothetical protein